MAATRSALAVACVVFCWNTLVALAPVSAAVASSSVSGAVMAGSLLMVLAVAGEFGLVELDAEPGCFPDAKFAVVDLQRFGEQVVGHVEEVGQLPGTAGGELVGGAEGEGAQRAELAVDLVAHHDLDAESFTQAKDALGVGEPGTRGFDADSGGGAAEQFAGDLGRPGDALVGVEGDAGLADEPAAAEDVVGGAEFLGEGEAEAVEFT